MADKNRSQPQQDFASIAEEQIARLATMGEESAKLQEQALEKAHESIDEIAKLWKESFSYGAKLNSEWRRLSLEAMRRGVAAVPPMPAMPTMPGFPAAPQAKA